MLISTVSRLAIVLVGIAAVGGFWADVVAPGTSRRHLRNPAWPPHAKFHNGQGVLMGIGLAILTPWLLFGLQAQSTGTVVAGALSASMYWWSMLGAILLPETAWSDPEFIEPAVAGIPLPKLAALAFLGLDAAALACAITVERLAG